MITVTAEPWERLQALAKEAGMPVSWLSSAIDGFVPGLLAVVEQAREDAKNRRQMTEAEGMARYLELLMKGSSEKE